MKESRQRIFYAFFALGVKFTQAIKVKKLIYIAIFLQLSISSLLLADPNDLVNFTDPNLQTAVADALGLEPPITEGQMLNLHSLTANSIGISDLTGLEYATNVNELHLSGNLISNLWPISYLTGLIKLNLNNNQITDISALEYTPDVNELHLSGNLISDLSPISGLTSLIYLFLNNNQITDISAVEDLENLDTLFLSVNDVNDISPISELTGLTSLYLASNQISGDISSLSDLSNLTALDLTNNQIDDISDVSNLTSLEELYLTNNDIVNISAVSNLASLQYLYLANNQIVVIPDMSNLTSLITLVLTDNQIVDILGLTGEEPNDLETLLLTGNPLNQISYCTYRYEIINNNPLTSIAVDDGLHSCHPYDTCFTAIDITDIIRDDPGNTYSGDSSGATGAEESSCGQADYLDVWHSYTPDSNEVVDISLCGTHHSEMDTTLAVFASCSETEDLACNDDFCRSSGNNNIQAKVTMALTGGVEYMIRVSGYSEDTGEYELTIEPPPDPPVNNTCQGAIEVVQYSPPETGSTTTAYGTDITSCAPYDARSVWYSFSPTISGRYLIDLNGSDYNTCLAVFDDCGGTELACNNNYCEWDTFWKRCGNGSYIYYISRIIVSADVGETYYIRIAGHRGGGGDYSLTVTLASDIDKDGDVDMIDLSLLKDEWLQDGMSYYVDIAPEEADGGEDGGGDKFIDLLDVAEVCTQFGANP